MFSKKLFYFVFLFFPDCLNAFDSCKSEASADVVKIYKDNVNEIIGFFKDANISVSKDELTSFISVVKRFKKNLSDLLELFGCKSDDIKDDLDVLLKFFEKGIFMSYDGTDLYLSVSKDKLKSNYERLHVGVSLWEGPNIRLVSWAHDDCPKMCDRQNIVLAVFYSSNDDISSASSLVVDVYYNTVFAS